MAVKKIAISVPEDVLDQVDRASAESGENRSRFISRMLMLLAKARSELEISRRINAVFADPEIRKEQAETARRTSSGLARRNETKW